MPDFSKIWATNSPLPEFSFTDEEYLTGWDFVAAAPPTKNQFDAWFRATDEKLKYLYDQLQNTASKLYPVGSVYISFNDTDPSTLFGGVWQRLKDTFLLANGDTYAANTSGGSATKTITVNNMPAHNHTVNESGNHNHTATTSTAGNHTHTRGSMNIVGSATNWDSEPWGSADYFTNSGALTMEASSFSNGAEVSTYEGGGGFRLSLNAANGWSGETSWNGSHSHTLTTTTAGAHTHTTNNTGDGLPLNIMPPYTTVYMWRRTA